MQMSLSKQATEGKVLLF